MSSAAFSEPSRGGGMKRNGKEFAEAPLWLRELHAYRASRRRVRVTLASRVDVSLSRLPLCGLVALQALGNVIIGEDEDGAQKTA